MSAMTACCRKNGACNPIGRTRSVCPECLRSVDAELFERSGSVLMRKRCPEHGAFEALIWEDAAGYRAWTAQEGRAGAPFDAAVPSGECPLSCGLCPDHEGDTCTAIFHLTDRCDLGCPTCFAAAGPGSAGDDLTLPQVQGMFETCMRKACPPTVQLSGGEPTLRDDLPFIVAMGKQMGVRHIQVNTNGIRLAQEPGYARNLAQAGLDLVYLQFDGCDDEVYRALRGRALLDAKVAAIENCRRAGLGVLLVVTVVAGVNDGELGRIVRFAKGRMPTVKGIHLQPLTHVGRCGVGAGAITTPAVLARLDAQTGGEVPLSAIVPRRKASALCSFSAAFLKDDAGRLRPLTRAGEDHQVSHDGRDGFVAEAVDYADRFWRASPSGASGAASEPEPGCCCAAPASGLEAGCCRPAPAAGPASETASCCGDSDLLADALRDRTLSISGMHFQDAWNLDFDRLRGCCVHVVTPGGLSIPFCAYYLTSASGERLYGPGGLLPRSAAAGCGSVGR